MNIKEIKEIAAQHGVKAGKLRKGDLIRAIQEAEGNPACFESDKSITCGEKSCLWKEDCV